MVLSFLVATTVAGGFIHHMEEDYKQREINAMIPAFSTNISTEDVNNMHLILNDDDCSDTFFQGVVDQLREDGLSFEVTSGGEGINQNNSTIVTLDQQYSAGPGTIIFAPYDNARVGESDALALSMQAAFQQNGFFADDIICGKSGYQVDDDGNVQTTFPTNTEELIDEGYDSSYVTISFGTQNQNPEWVAKSIENGLARQNYYLKENNSQTDLIYRANSSDVIDNVAGYFGTDASHLKKYNHLDDGTFRDSQTIINPNVDGIASFDKTSMFQIDEAKTRAY